MSLALAIRVLPVTGAKRREIGIVNIGGQGSVEVDGSHFEMDTLDSLYVGRGSTGIIFSSTAATNPAKFYFVSYPAHKHYPTTRIAKANANRIELGEQDSSNKRTIFQPIRPGIVETCQIVMGFTILARGNVWNTFPPHTHQRRSVSPMQKSIYALLAVLLLCGGCNNDSGNVAVKEPAANPAAADSLSTVAINVGGNDTVAPDGLLFVADEKFATGGIVGVFDNVLATPHTALYESFRSGEFHLAVPLAAGAYDVTFHFAEPEDIENSARVFDVVVEGKILIARLDIRAARGDKSRTALSRTLPNIDILDGQLSVAFEGHKGASILNGLTVRPHRTFDKSNYTLLWSDEFEIDGPPDPLQWNVEVWDARRVNDEAQAYTDRSKNVRVENGALIIEAHKEQHRNAEYTSARLTSKGKGDFLYGRVETRAKLPLGGGTWPAIWIYPTDQFRYSGNCGRPGEPTWVAGCAAWPNSGEIDIMEHVGNTPGIVHSSIHTKAYYWVNGQHRNGTIQVDRLDESFRVFAINWTPDRLDVFVDDVLFYTYLREENADWTSWPFDHPYHVILNLAMGGMWGGKNGGINDAQMPQRLTIDYVRVYEFVR